jgi:hypothetical protein
MALTIYPECVVPVRWHINGPTASAHLEHRREFNGIGGLRSYNRDRANCGHFTLPQLWPQRPTAFARDEAPPFAPVNLRSAVQPPLIGTAFVRGRWPPIKIIASSGLVPVEKDDLPEGSIFLTKPYTAERITTALRELTKG